MEGIGRSPIGRIGLAGAREKSVDGDGGAVDPASTAKEEMDRPVSDDKDTQADDQAESLPPIAKTESTGTDKQDSITIASPDAPFNAQPGHTENGHIHTDVEQEQSKKEGPGVEDNHVHTQQEKVETAMEEIPDME